MKKALIVVTIVLSLKSFAQSVNGYWYGYANVKAAASTNNYLIELILHQDRNSVKGIINYYFKQTYRSFKVNGNYNTMTRQLSLYNIPLTYSNSPTGMEVDCIMDMGATLRVAQVGSNLIGLFSGKPDYKYTCGDVGFNLKLNADISKEDSILREIKLYKETYQVWHPSADDTLVADKIIARPVVNMPITEEYKKRQNVVQKEIETRSDSLKVDFYDNGEIDGDSISIFLNNKLIAFNRMLSDRAVHFEFPVDSTIEYTDITMFADNLGSIPPNTALMVVTDGDKRYEIRMAANMNENATLRIRKKAK
jgi:hypothetical protein